jgi:hypothetical protein
MNISKEILNEIDHTIRRGYRRDVNAQLDKIVELIDKINETKGVEIVFDNSVNNRYTLVLNGKVYEFNLYRDIINALTLILEI